MTPARALLLAAGLVVASASPAVAAAPECPASVGELQLQGSGTVGSGANRTLQCGYLREVGENFVQVSLTVTWQVDREGPAAFVGASPCTGETLANDRGKNLSIAGERGRVGSYVTASLSTPGEIKATDVPGEIAGVLTRLVAEAETVALPCDSGEAATQSGQTAGGDDPGASTGSRDDSVAEEALLIAAGLLLALMGGMGPGRMARMLSGISGRRATKTALERVERPRRPPTPADTGAQRPPLAPAEQIHALDAAFADTVRQRLDEGHWVRNPDLIAKAWNTIRHPFWGTKSGQCGEFAAKGVKWMSEHVREQFGPGAVVDQVFVARRSVFVHNRDALDTLDSMIPVNHAATRVILPDGRRIIMDFWDAMGPSKDRPPRMVVERDWVQKWQAEIASGQISRSPLEQALRNNILDMGEERGVDAFRREAIKKGQVPQAETIVNSWRVDPW